MYTQSQSWPRYMYLTLGEKNIMVFLQNETKEICKHANHTDPQFVNSRPQLEKIWENIKEDHVGISLPRSYTVDVTSFNFKPFIAHYVKFISKECCSLCSVLFSFLQLKLSCSLQGRYWMSVYEWSITTSFPYNGQLLWTLKLFAYQEARSRKAPNFLG